MIRVSAKTLRRIERPPDAKAEARRVKRLLSASLTPREDQLQKEIVEKLRIAGAMVLENRSYGKTGALMASQVGDASAIGSPDLVCFLSGGITLCVELKRTAKDKPTIEQESWIAELRRRGHLVLVARSYREIVEFLESDRRESSPAFPEGAFVGNLLAKMRSLL